MRNEIAEPQLPVSEQAAAWFFELSERPASARTRREFVRWLKQSPQHIDAFLGIAMLEQELAASAGSLDDALRLAEQAAAGAIPLDADDTEAPPRRERRWRPRTAGWLAAAGLAALAVTAALWLEPREAEVAPVVHRTDYGEQRSIALADGSIVVLNTLSEAAVRLGAHERRVELVSGEAMFDVVPDPERPFVVETAGVELTVLGTRFSVHRKGDSVRVAVLEGVVRAMPSGRPGEPVLVRAGEGAVTSPDGGIRREAGIDLDKALAWTERRLVFDDVPLGDVVAEFNRYNRRPLIVQDPELAQRKITSVFFANDVSALVAFLELEPGIEVDYGADAIRIRGVR
ncbi:MAG TPA: FecR domain-containing protein [Woeseiaceae bacterium]|nr:FecR domain-containing protein [Woeseiaceae bacterium]